MLICPLQLFWSSLLGAKLSLRHGLFVLRDFCVQNKVVSKASGQADSVWERQSLEKSKRYKNKRKKADSAFYPEADTPPVSGIITCVGLKKFKAFWKSYPQKQLKQMRRKWYLKKNHHDVYLHSPPFG